MSDNKEISSLSYVNKDFMTIYPEMLDLAKDLTNKWDPSQSNESDPGIVLIKEGAFVADHNNYNIDKNVLENFLPSATQDRSVRNITEMNGYTPRYYVSANGYVTFIWTQPENDESTDQFSIPAFTFVISDEEETVSYTQIDDLAISGSGIPSTCRFIEGTIQTLSINDTSTISLENLDDNNRLYLPETMVAQNGIYIRNINKDDYEGFWERNNYLLTQPLGSRIYKIDYDSLKSLPYIEFPTDIANLIGDGLQIQYIATSGIQGNVSANTLTKVLSPSAFNSLGDDIERSSENFTIYNASSIVNGKDPETINEMYQSFRKIVGTFDTLVTCLDYENKIYSLTDSKDNPLVSNVYVTDRRTDYNKSAQVISWDNDNNFKRFKIISTNKCSLTFIGEDTYENIMLMNRGSGHLNEMYYCITPGEEGLYVNMSSNQNICRFVKQNTIDLNDFAVLTQAMTPYDLVMYGLKAFSMSDYNSSKYWLAYNNSFKPISSNTRNEIKNDIEEFKCISHTWNDPNDNEVYCFKNYAPLNILITPYNKVTEVEKNEIIDNIYKILSERFNPRNIEFGEKLDIEELEDAIVDADSRIRRVDLLPIEYNMKAMLANGSDNEPDVKGELLLDLVTKNILAGRICMFKFDESFMYDYGQVKCDTQYTDKLSVKTELYIPLKSISSDNVAVEQDSDVVIESTTYKSYGDNLMYEFIKSEIQEPQSVQSIASCNYGELGSGDSFILYEVDRENNSKILKTYKFSNTANVTIWVGNFLDDGELLQTTSSKTLLTTGDIVIEKKKGVSSIEAGVVNLDYTLNKNEAIQIIYPNYYSDTTYSTYVNYRYEGVNTIHANIDYTLEADEKIIVVYSQDGVQKQDIMYPGDVIMSSFDIIPTDQLLSSGVKKILINENGVSYNEVAFKQLSSNQTISRRKLMTTKFDSTGIWCYWIINSDSSNNNVLFSGGVKERILRSNEYFIYTNSALNELIILGAGTKLERTDSNDEYWSIPANTLTIESISNTGVSTSIPWQKNINFAQDPFYITEMNIITLGETDHIKITGWSEDKMPRVDRDQYALNYNGWDYKTGQNLNDGFSICDGSIVYTVNGTTATLPAINDFYQIKSRLDLNVGPGIEQELITTRENGSEGNIASSQRIILGDTSNDVISSDDDSSEYKNRYIQSSNRIVAIGNTVNLSDNTDFYIYSKDGNRYSRSIKLTSPLESENGTTVMYPFYCSNFKSKTYIIPIHMVGTEVPVTAWFEAKSADGITSYKNPGIGDYNYTDPSYDTQYNPPIASPIKLYGNDSYYLYPSDFEGSEIDVPNEMYLCLHWDARAINENETLQIEDIVVIDGVNPDIDIFNDEEQGTTSLENINNRIKSIISNSDKPSTKPYYPYKLDNSIAMDTVDFKNAYSMWDKNNIANKMTIAQIDLQNSVIDIVNDMRNY